jgi:tRNA (mo5U34)-methyltransferase
MSIQDQIKELAPWFHNIHLPDGTQTQPNHFLGDFPAFKWEKIKTAISEDLAGKKVLDIGCNAGYYSIELAKRGAEVLAIDLDPTYLKQAQWIARQFGLDDRITFMQMQVYDLAQMEQNFDIVWFMGVFYHLRYPMLAMDIVAQKVTGTLVFQTLSLPNTKSFKVPDDIGFHDREIMQQKDYPKMAFIEKRLAGDPTNWWVPNHQGIVSMLSSCGFRVTATPEDETYVAVRDTTVEADFNTWNYSEFLSATGKEWKSAAAIKTGGK